MSSGLLSRMETYSYDSWGGGPVCLVSHLNWTAVGYGCVTLGASSTLVGFVCLRSVDKYISFCIHLVDACCNADIQWRQLSVNEYVVDTHQCVKNAFSVASTCWFKEGFVGLHPLTWPQHDVNPNRS